MIFIRLVTHVKKQCYCVVSFLHFVAVLLVLCLKMILSLLTAYILNRCKIFRQPSVKQINIKGRNCFCSLSDTAPTLLPSLADATHGRAGGQGRSGAVSVTDMIASVLIRGQT